MTGTRAPAPPIAGGLLVIALTAFAIVATAATKVPASAALEAEVLGLIGDAACESHEQCRTVAFGAKACGGPQSYLAWSTKGTDEAALKAAAEQYAVQRRAEVSDGGMVSNCALVTDPGAYCAPGAAAAPGVTTSGPQRVCRLRNIRPESGQLRAD